jgi:hypothetical protein
MTENKFEFPQSLGANGIWTEKGQYILKELKGNEETGYYVFYKKEVGFGFAHAIEVESVWLEADPTKKLIQVKNLSLTCKMKSDAEDRWLVCNTMYYLTIQDAIGALTGQTRVYKPKRKPEVIREMTTEEIEKYWTVTFPKEE